MFCREKERYEVYILSRSNAEHVLDMLGYGEAYRNPTMNGRYGMIVDDGILFGSINMHSKIKYSSYIVFGYKESFYEVFTKKEFDELFEEA